MIVLLGVIFQAFCLTPDRFSKITEISFTLLLAYIISFIFILVFIFFHIIFSFFICLIHLVWTHHLLPINERRFPLSSCCYKSYPNLHNITQNYTFCLKTYLFGRIRTSETLTAIWLLLITLFGSIINITIIITTTITARGYPTIRNSYPDSRARLNFGHHHRN